MDMDYLFHNDDKNNANAQCTNAYIFRSLFSFSCGMIGWWPTHALNFTDSPNAMVI